MEYNNKFIEIAKAAGGIDIETLKTFTILLAPFAPHLGEELWEALGGEGSVFHAGWPEYDEAAMAEDEVEIALQVNGKTRLVISLPADISKDDALIEGKKQLEAAGKLTGNIIKEIYVPKKIINIVMK